jgi:hypothetical protein
MSMHIHEGASILPDVEPPGDLMEDGNIVLRTAAELDTYDRTRIRVWCHRHGRYGLVTTELIEFLRELIGGRKAIEIGSGHGDLAKHLCIHGTDNKMQARPGVVAAYYKATGQPVISYPDWVEKVDGVAAVRKHKPEVVVGSWITHWIDPRLPVPPGGGNMFGVRENEILKLGVTYVMIGNLAVHEYKPILKLPHEELEFPWLRSRASRPDLDRIFIWRP